MSDSTYTAFLGGRHLITAPLPELLRVLKAHHDAAILVFEDQTGRQVDFDLRGSVDDVLARHVPGAPRKGPGRPKLGVVAREVTLLPRHWAWLDEQRGGASATLRRLIDEARRQGTPGQDAARAAEAAGRVITALAGDLPNFEEASRALYGGQGERFAELTRAWPEDVRDYALRLAQPAFAGA
ncbi:hypothetical protein DAERI_100165 [Deinococcus aerius]|uniref:DUF2239 domain-containing protein n=1 Tax=Deinococcus aerius TaxID=200253 RepID=A0A2I9CXJ0_9DEIO|nr:DUF2239 family protein [Deinococcus aerius]GBF06802.1 hypothetical protein DAERI_100165 [Deinococcus aerius]